MESEFTMQSSHWMFAKVYRHYNGVSSHFNPHLISPLHKAIYRCPLYHSLPLPSKSLNPDIHTVKIYMLFRRLFQTCFRWVHPRRRTWISASSIRNTAGASRESQYTWTWENTEWHHSPRANGYWITWVMNGYIIYIYMYIYNLIIYLFISPVEDTGKSHLTGLIKFSTSGRGSRAASPTRDWQSVICCLRRHAHDLDFLTLFQINTKIT